MTPSTHVPRHNLRRACRPGKSARYRPPYLEKTVTPKGGHAANAVVPCAEPPVIEAQRVRWAVSQHADVRWHAGAGPQPAQQPLWPARD
jgi:hypothetical protein